MWVRQLWLALIIAANVLFSGTSWSQADATVAAQPSAEPAREFSRKGADTCLQCHDAQSKFPVMEIFKTPHGSMNKEHSGFLAGQCEACHGPIGDHGIKRLRAGTERQKMFNFSGKQPEFAVAKINAVCSSCHKDDAIGHWQGSIHQQNDTNCTACHSIHVQADPIRKPAGQIEKCGSCHATVKHLGSQFSSHPVENGKMACTDCHQPHGSNNDHLLKGNTVNETCHQCHADKRGPFLWEHEPVADDCTTCHNPHGSNQPSLLTQRPPFLCQQCHGSDGHPAFTASNSSISGPNPSAFVIGKSCVNCHSAVHGSNHPAGQKLQR